jgi:hypothetical protein
MADEPFQVTFSLLVWTLDYNFCGGKKCWFQENGKRQGCMSIKIKSINRSILYWIRYFLKRWMGKSLLTKKWFRDDFTLVDQITTVLDKASMRGDFGSAILMGLSTGVE